MILSLFRRNPRRAAMEVLYDRIAAASRQPALYTDLGIPDTVEGRFESLALHTVLLLRRLRTLPPPAGDVGQDFIDTFFKRMDASLRELGVGDMGVGKRMKKLAHSFYGRADAYDGPLDRGDDAALAGVLGRNALGQAEPAPALAAYVLASDRRLAGQSLDEILGTGPVFADPKETPR
ncbi:ubiquinol-cytochrome C chaperone family protein [Salinarimonas soli]|uniref:Ubiquinol-cytochrome C chaperone n=1 Tax=Salinarimonas soli TaxID=1638099 RepID=A0A5B2VHD5_9HYPH|nr:ubiquinol-cytochrome C chaperone family protein [Salinarimonas soli]KAA2238018.1 ubiquinol-cytochrome C chaperone [Salinarimonas soli]